MIRFVAWPQLGTAAAFVTAVAVVLNPITPVLPDVTVPAMPSGTGIRSRAAEPHRPSAAPVPELRLPAPAAVPVSVASPAAPGVFWQPALPTYAPAPALPTTPAVPQTPVVQTVSVPKELTIDVPAEPPAFQADNVPIGMAHTGDRPRVAAPGPFASPFVGNTPRPAAAVGAPDSAGPAAVDGDAVNPRGRGGAGRPDAVEQAPRGHRGTSGRD